MVLNISSRAQILPEIERLFADYGKVCELIGAPQLGLAKTVFWETYFCTPMEEFDIERAKNQSSFLSSPTFSLVPGGESRHLKPA